MKKKSVILLFSTLIGICLSFASCQMNVDAYTVWTDVSNYSEFQSNFGDLDNGMYTRFNISSSGWAQLSSSLGSNGKHTWDKAQIKEWFIGRGFGESEAIQETAWLTTSDHGMIASRTGNTVYYILK